MILEKSFGCLFPEGFLVCLLGFFIIESFLCRCFGCYRVVFYSSLSYDAFSTKECKTSNLPLRNRINPTEYCSSTMLTTDSPCGSFSPWKYETEAANYLEKLEYWFSSREFVFYDDQTWLFPTSEYSPWSDDAHPWTKKTVPDKNFYSGILLQSFGFYLSPLHSSYCWTTKAVCSICNWNIVFCLFINYTLLDKKNGTWNQPLQHP